MTALAKTEPNGDAKAYETALIAGDLKNLSPDERLAYYKRVCDSLGLNPLTRPFDYIVLNSKLVLYARKDCTEQLRSNRSVSVKIVGRELVEDCYVVTANARMPGGREDESIGAVSIQGLKGEARANAMMKAETKAKRRVTLSICGLGMLDETEVESIPDAHREDMSVAANMLTPEEQAAAKAANPQPPAGPHVSLQDIDRIATIAAELGLTTAQKTACMFHIPIKRISNLKLRDLDKFILAMHREAVEKMLTELALSLDDVRVEDSSVVAGVPGELDLEQAQAALVVLRACKERTVIA